MDIQKELLMNLDSGDINSSKGLFHRIDDFEVFRDCILKYTWECRSVFVYTFLCSLLIDEESADVHHLASELFSGPFCYLKEGYQIALYHARCAVVLRQSDVSFKEYLLLFNAIPEKLLTDEEALTIRHEILKIDPDSKTVKHHFADNRFSGRID